MQQFSYQGYTISSDARIDKEVDNRLAKASSAFDRLYKRVWNNKNMKTQTKISVYWTVVLTILLYGSEAWVSIEAILLKYKLQWAGHVSINQSINQSTLFKHGKWLSKLVFRHASFFCLRHPSFF